MASNPVRVGPPIAVTTAVVMSTVTRKVPSSDFMKPNSWSVAGLNFIEEIRGNSFGFG